MKNKILRSYKATSYSMHGPWYPNNHHLWEWEQESEDTFIVRLNGGKFNCSCCIERFQSVTLKWFTENVIEPYIKEIKSSEGELSGKTGAFYL